MNTPPTFGNVVVCRRCRGSGRVRGSGLDPQELERRRRIRAKDADDPAGDVPTTSACDVCGGRGLVAPAIADTMR
jgi:hypothetical protein